MILHKEFQLAKTSIFYLFISFSLMMVILFSNSESKIKDDLYGRWEGSTSNRFLSFIFNSDETCTLTLLNTTVNKREMVSGVYELDFSKKPITLSIKNIPQLGHPMHTIIEYVNGDSIRIAEFSPKWRLRPVSFDPGKMLGLKRVKQ